MGYRIQNEAPPVGGSKWFAHLPLGGGRGSWNLMLSSNLLKSKIPMLRGGGGLMEFDAELKFAKIQNCHVEGGFVEFDAEFKFAKIQNCHVEGGGAHGI